MKKIKVLISWSGDNYCADAASNDINGAVLVTASTLEGAKKEFQSALQFHIEGSVADGDELPEWLVAEKYELDYIMETSALLHSLGGILTRSAIARVSGINERQKKERIINGIQAISRELASVTAIVPPATECR
jgi:predicted RNase H-like HicB family nuclease